jgi:hypothetical protein
MPLARAAFVLCLLFSPSRDQPKDEPGGGNEADNHKDHQNYFKDHN